MSGYRVKEYPISDAVPGWELGRAVLTDSGKVALSEGTILTPVLIARLKEWGVSAVAIREMTAGQPDAVFPLAEEPPVSENQKKFYHTYEETIDIVKHTFDKMRCFRDVPLKEILELTDQSISPMVNSIGVMNHLHMVRRQDDYTYHHSVNVAVIAGVLGKWMGYSGSELKNLILAGFLHDVGKTQIPLDILNKPDKLSQDEMEIMKLHTTRGYQLIRDIRHIPTMVHFGVLQHHERIDGSGYPFKLKAEKIHSFAKIIAVADIYDAMTSDRVYRTKVTPFDVVEMLVREMFGKLDPSICTVFLNNVRDYFLGNIVELSDGRTAEVVHTGLFIATRPVVRTEDGQFIDLETSKDLRIVQLVRA